MSLPHPEADLPREPRSLPTGPPGLAGEPRSFLPPTEGPVSAAAIPNPGGAICDIEGMHRDLAHWNRERLGPQTPRADWSARMKRDAFMAAVESTWVETLREEVFEEAQAVPRRPEAFVEWFEALRETGPGQGDPLFPWLADVATDAQMRWFLTQEAAGEAGFDDLVALTQVKMPDQAKLELARNYWDEMGRGHIGGMHGPMLARAVEALKLDPTIEGTIWESLALANTLTAFATVRRYAWHSVGALGVVELTAPGRVSLVGRGLKRLDHPPAVRKYFELHASLDIKHSADWNANALLPLARDAPQSVPFIAEGALMRLLCGKRCFDAYRKHLWGPAGRRDAH